MSRREFRFLQSEVATLEGLLANLSQDRVIERLGLNVGSTRPGSS